MYGIDAFSSPLFFFNSLSTFVFGAGTDMCVFVCGTVRQTERQTDRQAVYMKNAKKCDC